METYQIISFIFASTSLLISIVTYLINRQHNQNTYTAILYAQNDEIRKIFITQPEFRPYFFDGKSISESDENFQSIYSLAELILNYLEHLALHKKHVYRNDLGSWSKLIDIYYKKSPIVRQVVKESKSISISPEFRKILAKFA
jgi:hypothetical protein